MLKKIFFTHFVEWGYWDNNHFVLDPNREEWRFNDLGRNLIVGSILVFVAILIFKFQIVALIIILNSFGLIIGAGQHLVHPFSGHIVLLLGGVVLYILEPKTRNI